MSIAKRLIRLSESLNFSTTVENGKVTVDKENVSQPELDSELLTRDNKGNIKIQGLKETVNREKASTKSANNVITKDKKQKSMKVRSMLDNRE